MAHKSFRIDDLLKGGKEETTLPKGREEKAVGNEPTVSLSSLDLRTEQRSEKCEGDSQVTPAPLDFSRRRSVKEDASKLTPQPQPGNEQPKLGANENPETLKARQAPPLPLVVPAVNPAVGNNSVQFGSDMGQKQMPYHPALFPFPMDAHRLNQTRSAFMHQNHHAPVAPLLLPNFPMLHGGMFPPGTFNFPIGHLNGLGHLAGPPPNSNLAAGSYEKNAFAERVLYAMYPFARHSYSSQCKRKGGQIRFNNSQTHQLEKAFHQQKYLNATDRKKLAQSLGLSDRQVKTWFQNRRAKLRKCNGINGAEGEMSRSPQDHNDESLAYENVTIDSPQSIDD